MNIDWSKAPEGATHSNREGTCFHKFGYGSHQYWVCGEWVNNPIPFLNYDTPGELVPVPWNGEGLPPVGTVCEALVVDQTNLDTDEIKPVPERWDKGEVVALVMVSGKRLAVLQADNCILLAEKCRLLRTPEQIAAEERKRIVEDIQQICVDGENSGVPFHEALYRAGYRKQVAL